MKIKLITLILCLTLILVTASCSKVESVSSSGGADINVFDTSVNFYHTDAFNKNKKQEIVLAIWDNVPRYDKYESSNEVIEDPDALICIFTKSDSTVKFQCIGEFDKNGKGKVNINEKVFDISRGRLFLINTHVKPIEIIQVNEQFNNLSPCEETFKYLAKNNKIVAAFLADSKSHSEKSKSKDLKKKD